MYFTFGTQPEFPSKNEIDIFKIDYITTLIYLGINFLFALLAYQILYSFVSHSSLPSLLILYIPKTLARIQLLTVAIKSF